MNTPTHMMVGAMVAAAPDVMLAGFGWRRAYIPPSHPLVRAHRWLHSPASVPAAAAVGAVVFAAAWWSHLAVDRVSPHPLPKWVKR